MSRVDTSKASFEVYDRQVTSRNREKGVVEALPVATVAPVAEGPIAAVRVVRFIAGSRHPWNRAVVSGANYCPS